MKYLLYSNASKDSPHPIGPNLVYLGCGARVVHLI